MRLEEYARGMIAGELAHQDEADRLRMKLSERTRGTQHSRLELCR